MRPQRVLMEPLDYASPQGRGPARLSAARIFLILDLLALAFFVSQASFLIETTSINIRESGVPPYGYGSSYNGHALGNAEFVAEFPAIAAFIARLWDGKFNVLSYPAFFANAFTFTVISWLITAYLIGRLIFARGVRRAFVGSLGVLMLATLPYIWWALVVAFD